MSANGDGTRTIQQECHDQAVQELALELVMKLRARRAAGQGGWETTPVQSTLHQYVIDNLDVYALQREVGVKLYELLGEAKPGSIW